MNIQPSASPLRALWLAAATAGLLAAGAAHAQGHAPLRATEDAAELARGATPDTTPQQRYNTAVREAYGARKNSLADCRTVPAAGRRDCQKHAQEQFQRDMAIANQLRSNPNARPVRVVCGHPRITSETKITPKK